MRIVSLLPSATEIVCRLGREHQLVGRSHECDYPASVQALPAITRPAVRDHKTSGDIHLNTRSILEQGLSLFETDADLLSELQPDIILTQDHCEVCAVPFHQVEKAVQVHAGSSPDIISLSPSNLQDVWQSIIQVGKALGAESEAKMLVDEIAERTEIIKTTIVGEPVKTVVAIEWLDPIMAAGNWIPEMIEIAGGEALMGEAGLHSPWADWSSIVEANPDVLMLMPCGFSTNQTFDELHKLTGKPGWHQLQAVQNRDVYVLDGNLYFNRPGPRLFESTRIFAEILHPEHFKPLFEQSGWERVSKKTLGLTG